MQDHCGSVSAFSENIDRIIAVLHPVTCPAAVVSARTSHDLLALATSRVQWQRVRLEEGVPLIAQCARPREETKCGQALCSQTLVPCLQLACYGSWLIPGKRKKMDSCEYLYLYLYS